MKPRQFSTLLVEENVVPFHKMEEAFQRQVLFGGRLGTNLLEIGALDERTLLYYLSESTGLPWAEREHLAEPDDEALWLLPLEDIEWMRVLPVKTSDELVKCIVTDPPTLETEETLKTQFQRPVEFYITSEFRFSELLEAHFDAPVPERLRPLLQRFPLAEAPEREDEDEDESDFWDSFELDDLTSEPDFSDIAAALAQGEESLAQGEEDDGPEVGAPTSDVDDAPASADAPAQAAPSRPQISSRSAIVRGLDDALDAFAEETERDGLVGRFLRFVSQDGRRSMVLSVGSSLRGFASEGFMLDRVTVRKLRVGIHDHSDLSHVRAGTNFYHGEASNAPELRDIYMQLGGDLPPEVLVAPVPVSQRIPLLVVIEAGSRAFDADELDSLFQAIHGLSQNLERQILEIKRAEAPASEAQAETQPASSATASSATATPEPEPRPEQEPQPPAETKARTSPPPIPTRSSKEERGEIDAPTPDVTSIVVPIDDDDDDFPEIDLIPLDEPANVIVDYDYWAAQLDAGDPKVAEKAREYLTADEPGAVDALIKRFPGNLRLARFHHARNMPPVAEHSTLLACLVAHGETIGPKLLPLLESAKPDDRFYAMLLLAELRSDVVLDHLHERFFDKDPQVRRLAIRVAKNWRQSPAYEKVRLDLELVLSDNNPRKLELATQAIGEFRDMRALHVLLPLLEHPNGHIAESAHRAMVAVALDNPGMSMRKWRRWLDSYEPKPRVEMIADAMLHKERTIRALVLDEIQDIPGVLLNYHPDASRRDRMRSRESLLAWTERSHESAIGSHLFEEASLQ